MNRFLTKTCRQVRNGADMTSNTALYSSITLVYSSSFLDAVCVPIFIAGCETTSQARHRHMKLCHTPGATRVNTRYHWTGCPFPSDQACEVRCVVCENMEARQLSRLMQYASTKTVQTRKVVKCLLWERHIPDQNEWFFSSSCCHYTRHVYALQCA